MPFCKHVVTKVIFVPCVPLTKVKTGQSWLRGGDNQQCDNNSLFVCLFSGLASRETLSDTVMVCWSHLPSKAQVMMPSMVSLNTQLCVSLLTSRARVSTVTLVLPAPMCGILERTGTRAENIESECLRSLSSSRLM